MAKGRSKKKNTATPWTPYIVALVCLIYCVSGTRLYMVSDFLILAAVLIGVGYASSLLLRMRRKKAAPEPEPVRPKKAKEAAPPPKAEPEEDAQYSPEVRKIIKEGLLAQQEMGRLYASIKDPDIRAKINEIMQVSDKIVQDAKHDPADVPQIQRFLSYYLPTTIKLLNAYDRMSDQGIQGDNITGTMNRIESMLDSAIAAYKKQLDSLFANQALDIETDIEVMNAMLAREGLAEDGLKAAKEKARQQAAQSPESADAAPSREESSAPAVSASPFGSASPVEKLRRDGK